MLIYEEIVNYEIHSAIFYVDKYKALRNAYYVASHILIRHKRNRAFSAQNREVMRIRELPKAATAFSSLFVLEFIVTVFSVDHCSPTSSLYC